LGTWETQNSNNMQLEETDFGAVWTKRGWYLYTICY